MRSARLTLALESGAFALPETGRIAVFRPRMGDDLSALPKDRLTVVQGFKPDHDAFAGLGYDARIDGEGGYAAAIVCLPRSRVEAHGLLAAASAQVVPGGLVVVDGQKTDGVDAIHRELRDRVAVTPALSKAHGKIFSFPAGPELAEWAATEQVVEGGYVTRPGVFSADGPDRGSMLLAAALPERLPARMADLGGGWGYLSRAVLAHPEVQQLDFVEAEAEALDCARANLPDARVRFHWADALTWGPEGPIDAVVCNPPFHTSRAADPSLGVAFIRAASGILTTSGTLWLVANRHLPYAPVLAETFREVEEIGGDGAFRLTRASRPIKVRR